MVQSSWLLIALVVTVLYTPVLRRGIPELGVLAYAVVLVFCLLLALSVLLHELAHAGAARAFGWPVERVVLSLTGGHTSFGRARSTWPASVVISLAGPLANLILAGIGYGALLLAQPVVLEPTGQVLWTLVSLSAVANLFLGLFNLLPGLPMDGGRVLEGLVWGITGRQRLGTIAAAWIGRVCAVLLAAAVLLLGDWRSVITLLITAWLVWMLLSGSADGLRRVRAEDALEGLRADELAGPAVGIPADASLESVRLSLSALEPGTRAVGIGPRQEPIGILEAEALARIPQEQLGQASLQQALRPVAARAVLPGDLRGHELLERAVRATSSLLVIIDADGAVTGVLSAAQLNERLERAGLVRPDGRPR